MHKFCCPKSRTVGTSKKMPVGEKLFLLNTNEVKEKEKKKVSKGRVLKGMEGYEVSP